MDASTRSGVTARRYEERLAADLGWAMADASRYFVGGGEVRATLARITQWLNETGVAYAVAGGLALFHHRYRRFTPAVDLLVTADSLRLIHDRLVGSGFVPPFTGSRHLRDTTTGVKVEFLVTGGYPGDGKPKAIMFPDPAHVAEESGGVRYLKLPKLIELKLASGLSAAHRGKDLVDVQELIRAARLPRDLADQLHPDVRPKYVELWEQVPRRYLRVWRGGAGPELDALLAAGVALDPDAGIPGDYSILTTSDPAVAVRYGLVDEADLWDAEPPGGDSGGAEHV